MLVLTLILTCLSWALVFYLATLDSLQKKFNLLGSRLLYLKVHHVPEEDATEAFETATSNLHITEASLVNLPYI